MSNNKKDKSCLRLFLSVDVVGSTNLKGLVNHATLLRSYEQSEKIHATLLNSYANDNQIKNAMEALQSLDDWEDRQTRKLLSDIGFGVADWATVLGDMLDGFHNTFIEKLQHNVDLSEIAEKIGDCVWKFLGDEMIYAIDLCDIKADQDIVHKLVVEFTKALREIDKAGVAAESESVPPKALRMKGTAWTAGFPIRNRQITVPGKKEESDFLGPDMDIGFRLREYSYPGILCMSLDLAYILAHVDTAHTAMCGSILDWERLKGVWNNIPYPIIWCTTPDRDRQENPYQELRPWASGDTPRVEKWRKIIQHSKNDEASATLADAKIRAELDNVYKSLPDSLFVEPPYIPASTGSLVANLLFGKVPETHKEIRRLLTISQVPPPTGADLTEKMQPALLQEGKDLLDSPTDA